MDMNNKTSDKNVGSIEDDVKLVKRYLENSAYKESNSDFFKNGGWEMVDLEIPKAMANILAEREQDKARIKELEEELEKANRQLDLDYVEENFIPKQVIKDKIEKIIRETTPTPVFKPKSMWDDTDYERLYKTQPLLELLEGEK